MSDLPEGMIECPECDGKGYIKCEHQEYDDHNTCLDCGYSRIGDLIDEAMNREDPK